MICASIICLWFQHSKTKNSYNNANNSKQRTFVDHEALLPQAAGIELFSEQASHEKKEEEEQQDVSQAGQRVDQREHHDAKT